VWLRAGVGGSESGCENCRVERKEVLMDVYILAAERLLCIYIYMCVCVYIYI
jgi:hypothetical protein